MYTLENNSLKIEVALKGAELKKIYNKNNNEDYLWSSNPEFWGKSSPVLFPHIGGQNNGKYLYNGKEYDGVKHGFARDMEFKFVEKTDDSLVFVLNSTEKTLALYPNRFSFYITYALKDSSLKIKYKIINKDDGDMYFSLGTHPAFATPFLTDNSFDYYLEFEQNEKGESYTIDEDGLIGYEKREVFEGNILIIEEETFDKGALVLEGIKSKYVILKNKVNNNEVKVNIENFPFLTIWAPEKAPFVCIEPWYGINDFKGFNEEISKRKGVQKLSGENSVFNAELNIEIN